MLTGNCIHCGNETELDSLLQVADCGCMNDAGDHPTTREFGDARFFELLHDADDAADAILGASAEHHGPNANVVRMADGSFLAPAIDPPRIDFPIETVEAAGRAFMRSIRRAGLRLNERHVGVRMTPDLGSPTSSSDYRVGDVIEITGRNSRGWHRTAARVTAVDYRPGFVTFEGFYDLPGLQPSGSGAFEAAAIGTKPFGFHKAVRIIGHQKPMRRWQPMPGDRGYDLMH